MSLKTSTHTSGANRSITPADATDLPLQGCRAIYVGVTGNISVVDLTGATTVFPNVAVGVLPVQAKGINATLTTATDLIALY